MIKAENGHVIYKGTSKDIVIDYMCITRGMMDVIKASLPEGHEESAEFMLMNTVYGVIEEMKKGDKAAKASTVVDASNLEDILRKVTEEGGNDD